MPGRRRAAARPRSSCSRRCRRWLWLRLVAVQLLLAGYSLTIADGAAEAGALAGAAGLDPRAAAREALPGWARERSTVE